MLRLKKQKSLCTGGMVALVGILCAALLSCKSPSGPDENLSAEINIFNTCGAAVDIYVNEVFKTALENDSDTTIKVVNEGIYQLGAIKTGSEIVVSVGQAQVYLGGSYTWDINGPSSIIVTNSYGETLQIHVNGTYLGDLDTSYSEEVTNVTFGEHTLEAKKPSTGEVAASITFEVNDAADYFWEITKEE